jgi:hypothetical protein
MENEKLYKRLIIGRFRAILDKKRLHLSGGSDTIPNSRGFL